MNNQTSKKLFPETGSVYFDPVFEGMRNRRKKPIKKPDPRFKDIEKSLDRAVVNGNVARLADNSQDGTLCQRD